MAPHSRKSGKETAIASPRLSRSAAAKKSLPAPVITAEKTADRATEDRVHNWYKAYHAAPARDLPAAETEAPARIANSARPPVHPPTPQPDLSPAPHKATLADFDRAAQKQNETIRTAAALNQTRSTADDDAAFAEASNIPSTAPTERVPAPFSHGDLPDKLPAPVPARPGTAALATRHDLPTAAEIDPRGDAEVLSGNSSTTAVPIHIASTDSAPMQMPKPAQILRVPAPATAAVASASKKPTLDPRTLTGMTDETFDSDDDAATSAKTAVALAGRNPAPAFDKMDAGDADPRGGPITHVNLYDPAGRLLLLPPMKGTHEILVHQNQMAIADGLDRIEDDNQMLDMRRLKLLTALPDNDSIWVDNRLPLNRRFARPWSVRFLDDLARSHYARFHTPLVITSAARTVAFQKRLVLTNGNAAPPTGEVASPHLYGQAIDIGKHGMSLTEISWMRAYLTPVETEGKIDVEEEFQQACFHISVYRRYLGVPSRNAPAPDTAPSRTLQQAKATPAKRHHLPTALLATGLR